MQDRKHPRLTPWAVGGAAGAVLLAVVLAALGGSRVYQALGNTYPGAVVSVGVSALQTVADGTAAVCVGSLAFCAFFTSPQPSGRVAVDGYAALRTAARAGWAWFAASVLLVPFEMADSAGLPLSNVLAPDGFPGLLHALYEPKAWLGSALVALVAAVGAQMVLTWRPTFLLTGIAALGPLCPAVVGHSSSNAGHDYATNAIVVHVLVGTLWLGVLVAVALHTRRGGARTERVLARYRTFALACWIVLGISGIIDALVLAPPQQLLGSEYGALVLVTAALFIVLGAASVWLRRRASSPVRLLGTELLVLLITIGVSVAMTHLPAPSLTNRQVTASQEIIGYDLPDPPTVLNLLTTWRFDLILGTAAVLLAVLYLVALRRLRRRGETWPLARTVFWLCGCASVLVATSSGLGVYSAGVLSLHMIVHMVLNMVSPVLFVLGAPVSLALRLLPEGDSDSAGPREWLLTVLHSPLMRVLAHPAVSSIGFVGSFYLLYFTDLFEQAMTEHWAHELMKALFLLVGFLYYWTVIATDPTPRPLPHLVRLGMVFAAMPFHSVFGVIVLSMRGVIAENFYRELNPPWAPNLLTDQHLAGGIAWAAGEVPLAAVLVALLVQWYRDDTRGVDEDSDAYRAMFDRLARSRR